MNELRKKFGKNLDKHINALYKNLLQINFEFYIDLNKNFYAIFISLKKKKNIFNQFIIFNVNFFKLLKF